MAKTTTHQARVAMQGRLKGKEQVLFLAWIRGRLGDLATQGVEVDMETVDKHSHLLIQAPDEETLARAVEHVGQTLRQN